MSSSGWLLQNMKLGFYQRFEAAPINTELSPSRYEELRNFPAIIFYQNSTANYAFFHSGKHLYLSISYNINTKNANISKFLFTKSAIIICQNISNT